MVTVLLYNSLLRPQLKSSLSSEHQFKVLRKISIIQDLCLTEARKLKIQFSSVTQSCPTLCDPMDCSTPGLPVYHQLPEFTQTMSIESMMPFNQIILCCPLLLLPSIFPNIRVFSNESALCIRWPKYWSFSFSPYVLPTNIQD